MTGLFVFSFFLFKLCITELHYSGQHKEKLEDVYFRFKNLIFYIQFGVITVRILKVLTFFSYIQFEKENYIQNKSLFI